MGTETLDTLLVRSDADVRIGTGHIMRCLSLAEAWVAAGGKAVFLSRCVSESLIERIQGMGIEYVPFKTSHPDPTDLKETLKIIGDFQRRLRNNANNQAELFCVIDGYNFDDSYQRAIRSSGCRLLLIDDMVHHKQYHADIILNQNIGAQGMAYNCDKDTVVLAGTEFVILRGEFLKWSKFSRTILQTAKKVLVTMGGSDPDNVTLKVIKALEKTEIDDLEAVVVAGGTNPHVEVLESAIQSSGLRIRLECNAKRMPELMAWADVAVSGGGTTCWELSFMGLPFLVIVMADNQRLVAEGLTESKAAINLGWHGNVTEEEIARVLTGLLKDVSLRSQMSEAGRQLVDGNGISRVIMSITGERFRLREARQEDARLVWTLANDSQTRQASFSPDKISWQDHQKWFDTRLKDPACVFYLAFNGSGECIGQARFDMEGKNAVISVNVAPEFRGQGYGTSLISKSSESFLKNRQIEAVYAYIKKENIVSQRAFQKAGFVHKSSTVVRGNDAEEFVFYR